MRNVIVVGLLAGLAGPTGNVAEAGETGLIAHYPFDGKGACYLPLEPVGKDLECLEIDGRDGVRFGGQSHLKAEGAAFDSPSMSISLWFYLNRTDKDEMKLVTRDLGKKLQRIFQLQVFNPTLEYGDSRIRFLAETHAGSGWEIAAVTETSSILPGNWAHLVITVKAQDDVGPGRVAVWINGRQERILPEENLYATKRSLSKALQKTANSRRSPYLTNFVGGLATDPEIPLTIGSQGDALSTFDGVIDDLQIFDYPLGRDEVRALYRRRP